MEVQRVRQLSKYLSKGFSKTRTAPVLLPTTVRPYTLRYLRVILCGRPYSVGGPTQRTGVEQLLVG